MYGPADPEFGSWWRVPAKFFWAYVQMMPRVEAERELAFRTAVAAGSGTMPEKDQREYVRALRRQASGGRLPRARKATVQSLAAIGIPVITEPAPEQKGAV